jgi:hypothetical protein
VSTSGTENQLCLFQFEDFQGLISCSTPNQDACVPIEQGALSAQNNTAFTINTYAHPICDDNAPDNPETIPPGQSRAGIGGGPAFAYKATLE